MPVYHFYVLKSLANFVVTWRSIHTNIGNYFYLHLDLPINHLIIHHLNTLHAGIKKLTFQNIKMLKYQRTSLFLTLSNKSPVNKKVLDGRIVINQRNQVHLNFDCASFCWSKQVRFYDLFSASNAS